MSYVRFENAGVEVSRLAVGTWGIGGNRYGSVDRDEAIRAIRAAIDHGVNVIDTAPAYGNGTAEKLVGEALQDGYRDRVLISTKCGTLFSQSKPGRDASFKNIMREIDSSLYNLQTDHIDFYTVHWPDLSTHPAETMAALNLLREEGKIRFVSLSNHPRERVEEFCRFGEVDAIQPSYCMANRAEEATMKWAYGQGIGAFTYGSMGAGVLSGRYRGPVDFAPNDYRLTFYEYFREPMYGRIQELLPTLDEIASAHRASVSQVVLNWTCAKPWSGCALVGLRTVEHAIENCAAFDWELSDEELSRIDAELERLGL